MRFALAILAAALALPTVASARPLLLISIDGLRPGDIAEADKRGLKIPNLRRFLKEGSVADNVVGVLPTLTYPSHTTIITGVSPAKHGILSNTSFDPTNINQQGWYWYSSDIKVPTLWDAVRAAGKSTGNVHWPVSVGQRSIDYNLPQIWRTGHADDDKLLAALSTPGLLPPLEQKLDAYAHGIDESIAGDETRGRFAEQLIADDRPYFLTVYLAALDHQEHVSGPGSADANAVLERLDAVVGRLIAAEMKAQPEADVALVSDHGFAATDTDINLYSAFIKAGLVRFDAAGTITGWDASLWPAGGSMAVVLARPGDKALHNKVAALLTQLKADPAAKIERIVAGKDIAAMGGNPQASFFIAFQPGAITGPFKGPDAPVSSPASHYKGMHGYFPDMPQMRSAFMLMGPGIRPGQSLGQIDMRAIAPTLAKIMGVPLPDAEAEALLP